MRKIIGTGNLVPRNFFESTVFVFRYCSYIEIQNGFIGFKTCLCQGKVFYSLMFAMFPENVWTIFKHCIVEWHGCGILAFSDKNIQLYHRIMTHRRST